jgi:hypothetical protein
MGGCEVDVELELRRGSLSTAFQPINRFSTGIKMDFPVFTCFNTLSDKCYCERFGILCDLR